MTPTFWTWATEHWWLAFWLMFWAMVIGGQIALSLVALVAAAKDRGSDARTNRFQGRRK